MAREAGVRWCPSRLKNSDVLMGKGTGEARSAASRMVLLPPVETVDVKTDDDIDRLIAEFVLQSLLS
jgi:hypothetical protein